MAKTNAAIDCRVSKAWAAYTFDITTDVLSTCATLESVVASEVSPFFLKIPDMKEEIPSKKLLLSSSE